MDKANFVTEVTVIDPDSKGEVQVSIFKSENSGGMFGIDSSFIEQNFEEDEEIVIKNPLDTDLVSHVILEGV